MGVILYTRKMDQIIALVVSPLWGLFLLLLHYKALPKGCFPVMGVIPNQVLKKWHRMGRFPVIGVILWKTKSQKKILVIVVSLL